MTFREKVSSTGDGQKVLVIYSGNKPEGVLDLLVAAGCNVAEIVYATPTELVNGDVDPADFDQIFAILSEDLACAPDRDESALAVAQCGGAIIGVWPANSDASATHPMVTQYGKAQVPWNADAVSQALGDELRPLLTPRGTKGASISIKHNKCN